MENLFIISQFTSLIAWTFFLISYHAKRENKIILLQFMSSMFYSISYLLVGALTGFFISMFEAIKVYGCYKTDKDKYIFLFTLPIYFLIALISEHSLLIIIPIIASIIDGYAILRNNKIIVLCGTVSNLMWIYYDLYYMEYVTALGDLCLVVSNLTIIIYGIIKYLNGKNIKITCTKELNDDDVDTIKKLDDLCYDKIYRWPSSTIKKIYLKEKDSYILVKDKNKIVGYVNFLNTEYETYQKVLDSNVMIDIYEANDVIGYKKNKKLYINLNSIVLRREYNNNKIIKRLKIAINKYINKKIKNNYKIKELYIYTVNELEEKVVLELGFKKIKKINNECLLYQKSI